MLGRETRCSNEHICQRRRKTMQCKIQHNNPYFHLSSWANIKLVQCWVKGVSPRYNANLVLALLFRTRTCLLCVMVTHVSTARAMLLQVYGCTHITRGGQYAMKVDTKLIFEIYRSVWIASGKGSSGLFIQSLCIG